MPSVLPSPTLRIPQSSIDVSNNAGPDASEPLYQVKLLAALRSGDPALIHPFLTEIGKDKRKSAVDDIDTGAAALHLAIRCATPETVSLLLSHRAISPNGVHPPKSGTTPLHLASRLGRVDVVNILLDEPGIDDTLKDSNGKVCRDLAKSKQLLRAIDDSRSFLNASFRSHLHTYILQPLSSPPSPALISLLESPRVKFVNLSYLDDDTGTSLLHEAARRKDLRLIELVVRAGADVFVRDRRGKVAYEGSGKDDRVRVFLRQFANHDTTLIDSPTTEPPTLKGYLNKYTNVARGYNTRWFVLKNGVLSYYRHQEDETVTSRGSISMKTAVLRTVPGEKLRFEVQSLPSKGHTSGVQKWHVKANHPVEASRWIQAVQKSIEWYKREADHEQPRRKSIESDHSGIKSMLSSRAGTLSHSLMRRATNKRGTVASEVESNASGSFTDLASSGEVVSDASPSMMFDEPAYQGEELPPSPSFVFEDQNEESSVAESTRLVPPHEPNFDLIGNSALAQAELTHQLMSGFILPSNATPKSGEVFNALKDSFGTLDGLLGEYVQMVRDREDWWRRSLEKERQRQSVWEESLAIVVKEGEALERELRTRSRNRGSRFFDASFSGSLSEGTGTVRARPSTFGTPAGKTISEETTVTIGALTLGKADSNPPPQKTRLLTGIPIPGKSTVSGTPAMMPNSIRSVPLASSPPVRGEGEDIDTDEEDEFFDAIEMGNLPNLVVPEQLKSPPPGAAFSLDTPSSNSTDLKANSNVPPELALDASYAGYRHLRQALSITSDDRPSTSLWSVLKHSIGKDLTKISFPVFFNEPTSMLQRMAEDMEFSECLDVAAKEIDAHRRVAFVAAFAMSNYSSTIGRIAKPFNPMLGETFEYVRLDKEYRYFSEQVSHHPPISACWAESPSWRYYGEVDAQNKFMGKSFEIRPTGVAHADLLLPEKQEPEYPRVAGKMGKGKVVEHYSWKKVTTNVSGFILGSPTIDHYGEMTVTNHRTGDQCVLTFKPRGWRGRDAFEIAGHVKDASGTVVFEIAGRWNSQLVARAVGTGSGFLHPDVLVNGLGSPSTQEFVLLWRNSEKPPAPFNLTPFAITLNDCPESTLKPFLPPTDCRLRPDQRAFELGQYELANDLKNAQEEKQRATRRAREEGKLPPHKPRWFSAETDGDTGERLWVPSKIEGDVEYWIERDSVWRTGGKTAWKDVDAIFIKGP